MIEVGDHKQQNTTQLSKENILISDLEHIHTANQSVPIKNFPLSDTDVVYNQFMWTIKSCMTPQFLTNKTNEHEGSWARVEHGHLKGAWSRGLYGSKMFDSIWNGLVENLPELEVQKLIFKNKKPDLKRIRGQSDLIWIDLWIIRPDSKCGQPKQILKVQELQQWLQNDTPPKRKWQQHVIFPCSAAHTHSHFFSTVMHHVIRVNSGPPWIHLGTGHIDR